jgi:hypothetical protein
MVKKDKKLLTFVILFLLLVFVIALNLYLYNRAITFQNLGVVEIKGFGTINISKEQNVTFTPTEILRNCTSDEDCAWMITNCCKEEMGAEWQCLNKNSYIDCKSKLVLCPNISVPKPKADCKCINNTCSGFVFIVTQ